MQSGQQNIDQLPVTSPAGLPEAELVDGPAEVEQETREEESVGGIIHQQDLEAEKFAIEFLKKVLRLRGVHVERVHFLKSELHKRGVSSKVIESAIESNPAAAGISQVMLDEIAQAAIDFETRKSSVASFAAGLPGGFAMLGTVPADLLQYYVHTFRVMQKIAYVYGWQEFLADTDEVDDETLGKLTAFLGVMLGVGGASQSIRYFAVQVARPALQKNIAKTALTKTSWYPVMKQTLRIIGVQVTKNGFAKAVTKVVPVVGGVLSGGLTFVALNGQANKLMNYLREIPPPHVDAEEYLANLCIMDEENGSTETGIVTATKGAATKVQGAVAGATRKILKADGEATSGSERISKMGARFQRGRKAKNHQENLLDVDAADASGQD